MSKIVLYGMDLSPPVRACLLTLNELNIPFEYKIVNLMAGEHFSEEFTKHNPQSTVPVLEDNGTWLWDSHAICAYLVEKYAKSDELYPKDLIKRAIVDQRLHFDSGILFPALRSVTIPLMTMNVTVVPQEKIDRIIDGYDFLEKFFADNPYLTGDKLTLADFSCVATVTSLNGIVPIDAKAYPKIAAWIERMSQLPYYEKANGNGVRGIVKFLRKKLTKIDSKL